MKIFVNGKAVEVETNSKVCDILSGYNVAFYCKKVNIFKKKMCDSSNNFMQFCKQIFCCILHIVRQINGEKKELANINLLDYLLKNGFKTEVLAVEPLCKQ